MAGDSFAQTTKRRTLGVLFLAVAVGFVWFSIAVYNKDFTSTVDVTLRSDHLGNQLLLDSDVKERGIIVGSVKQVRAVGNKGAIVTLALSPDRIKDIPADVSAQILPKTLFGEQYVSLSLPKACGAPSQNQGNSQCDGPHIKAGDVIPQDRSKGALEAQDVLGDLLPLLTAVQPAELNSTLTAIATALNGRGPELGRVLTSMDQYLKIINPHTKALVDDIGKLGNVALEYNSVAPDIFATLQNLQTSVRTVVQKKQNLDNVLTTGTSTSNIVAGFLADNEQRLISVSGQSAKVFGLLQEYSPEFTCLFNGINQLNTGATKAIYNGSIHLNITADPDSGKPNEGKYYPGQEPTLVTGYGPNCFGLPHNVPTSGGNFQIPPKYRCLNDGAPLTTDPCATKASAVIPNPSIGSAPESALVNTLIAGALHTTPDKVPATATLLAAPLLRGHQVVVK